MNFNNGLYVFSEVPGYDASKGERIVKAFQKLWVKIANFEQVRMLEKKTVTTEVQTNTSQGLTLADVQYELLLTQLHYIIKIVREYANNNSVVTECKDSCAKKGNSIGELSQKVSQIKSHDEPDTQISTEETHPNVSPPDVIVSESVPGSNNGVRETRKDADELVGTDGVQTTKRCISSTNSGTSHVHSKMLSSQPHYHLKLDDVPFILGASSSASHSVIANVQNIIAMMKMHNKALCAPKPPVRHMAPSASSAINKANTQNANEMLQELSEDLSKLAMRQEKLKEILDNPQRVQTSDTTREEVENSNNKKEKIKPYTSKNCFLNEKPTSQASVPVKNSRRLMKCKTQDAVKSQEKLCVPVNKINNSSQVARRKMLRSLQDFKIHLSEEDVSWD